jgi:putative tryptophan/tyrosine transport system substrate-binding protein
VQPGGAADGRSQGRGRTGPRRALLLAGAACGMVGLLHAQPSRTMARIGFLGPAIPDAGGRGLLGELRAEMERLGWAEGSRVQYVVGLPGETGTPESTKARIATKARELVAARVDLIVAMTTRCAVEAKSATATIPIVFLAEQPVENGLVASLARPGGNVTGATYHIDLLAAKRIQLLKQAFPSIRRMGYLAPSGTRYFQEYLAARTTGRALDVEVLLAVVEHAEDVERAFNAAPQVDAWIIEDYTLFSERKEQIAELVATSRKPAMYGAREWVEAGGLMAYSDDRADWPRRVASLADRVLRGAKPAELPVDEPTRFLLVTNRKSARALGVSIAPSVLMQATEVIE